MATIHDLPNELFTLICERTDSTRQLKALRRTSRKFHAWTEPIFIKRLFQEVEINIDEPSLNYLCSVAASRFSGSVRVVSIRPRWWPRYGSTPNWASPSHIRQLEMQRDFAKNGQDEALLRSALVRFANLQRVDVEATTTPAAQDRMPHVRFSKSMFVDSIGQNRRGQLCLYHAFSIASSALQGTSVRELRAGTTLIGTYRCAIGHTALDIGRKIGRKIQELDLSLETTPGATDIFCDTALSNFLQITRILKVLKLSFWHSCADWLNKSLVDVEFRTLHTCHLEGVRRVDFQLLKGFIARQKKTLRSIRLINIWFENDGLASIVPTLFGEEEYKLTAITLQQLCSTRSGMLLFGSSADIICDACLTDLVASWTWLGLDEETCEHTTLSAESGELQVKEALRRLDAVGTLPWQTMTNKSAMEHAGLVSPTQPPPDQQEHTGAGP